MKNFRKRQLKAVNKMFPLVKAMLVFVILVGTLQLIGSIISISEGNDVKEQMIKSNSEMWLKLKKDNDKNQSRYEKCEETITKYKNNLFHMEDLHNKNNELRGEKKTKKLSVNALDKGLQADEILSYAYDISDKDKRFVKILVAENGTVNPKRRSDIIGANGHWDWGVCQLNYQWHKPFIDSEDFKDWNKQVDYCYGVYQDAIQKNRLHTTFYGAGRLVKNPVFKKQVESLLTFND